MAVIGAGISGLISARTLADHGLRVCVFDKGRGMGGRAATRRADRDMSFDHGAQYFTVRDPVFSSHVTNWQSNGVIAEWSSLIVKLQEGSVENTSPQTRYVGMPGMSAIGTHLAKGLDIRSETLIRRISNESTGWKLFDDTGAVFGPYGSILIALPAPQAAELLAPHPFSSIAASVSMAPCWAVMLAFESRFKVPWDGAFVHGSPLSWITRNSSKPGRPSDRDCWVLHAGPQWSADHLDDAPETVGTQLLNALATATGNLLPEVSHLVAHRWRFSMGSSSEMQTAYYDRVTGLAMCGDWLAGGRIEGAFCSGLAAAMDILGHCGIINNSTHF
ncbi:MAG: FAD-dependent oxidoreductase [Zavarzinella sp.]